MGRFLCSRLRHLKGEIGNHLWLEDCHAGSRRRRSCREIAESRGRQAPGQHQMQQHAHGCCHAHSPPKSFGSGRIINGAMRIGHSLSPPCVVLRNVVAVAVEAVLVCVRRHTVGCLTPCWPTAPDNHRFRPARRRSSLRRQIYGQCFRRPAQPLFVSAGYQLRPA